MRTRRRHPVPLLLAVAVSATAVAGVGTSAGAAPVVTASGPVAQVAANHGIPALVTRIRQLRDARTISQAAYAELTNRAQLALKQERTGNEARTVRTLQELLARVQRLVTDPAVRAELVASVGYAIAWLEQDAADERSGSTALQRDVTLAAVMEHLEALQELADANGGDRFAGNSGHDASAEYVHDLLDAAGYDVSYQEFSYSVALADFQQISPDARSYQDVAEFNAATATGYGDVTGRVVPVDVNNNPQLPAGSSNTSGCEAADFAGFPAGTVALLQRGSCDFGLKVANAQAAGAVAAVIYNEGTPGVPDRNSPVNPTVANYGVVIPVVGTTYAIGRDLMDPATTTVRVRTAQVVLPTRNVIAETPGGDPDHVVVLGGHLDSVESGPGINDNGSGSAALLETALQMAGDPVNNKVRFAWWSAEESGLVGSTYYVHQLSQAERDRISLYLNFDMVGSPNYFRGVYDGSGTLGGTAPRPPGSAAIEQLFNTHFGFDGLPYQDTEFSGRSDYQAFINSGIPAGGLFTGAEVPKTAAQVQLFGGVAGASFDPCYHQACDSLDPLADGGSASTYAALATAYGDQLEGNLNTYALDTSADAIAHAAATYAFSTASVEGAG